MKIILSQNAMGLIKYILINTGEKEVNAQGQEIDAQRRLNDEESAQRRHYLKIVNPFLIERIEKINALLEKAKEAWKTANVKIEKEEAVYEARMNQSLNADKALNDAAIAINAEKKEVELTAKTIAVIKKYFTEFGKKNGWLAGDDEFVEEIVKIIS